MKRLINKIEGHRPIVYNFIILLALFMSLTASNNPFCIGNTGTDSAVFNYVARVILHGGMPYRDTFDHKGPLIYLIDVFGLLLNADIGIWIIEFVCIFLIFLFGYKIAKTLGCNDVKSLSVVIICELTLSYYFEGGNLVEEYACPFIMISLLIFIKYFLKGYVKPVELVFCGISFSAVCLLRINMIALWLVMFIGVLITYIKRKQDLKTIIKHISWFVVGMIVVALPIIVWLIKNNAFDFFIEDYLRFNFMYSSDAERASIYHITQAIYYFVTGAPVVLAVPILLYFCLVKKEILDWLCMLTVLLTIAMMCISGQSYAHYGMILCPLVVYAVSRLLSELSLKFHKRDVALAISGVCMVMLLFAMSFYQLAVSTAKVFFPYKPHSMVKMQEIANVIKENTDTDDKITVCGNRNIIYLLAERESSSIYSYQYPIADVNPMIEKEYIDDIQRLTATIIIVENDSVWYERIDSVLDKHYRLIDTVDTTEIYLLENKNR